MQLVKTKNESSKMFLLNNFQEIDKYSVILCNDKEMLNTLTYEQMVNISEILKNKLTKRINSENICLGLLMDHNLYIPSIILSLQKLKYSFMFLTLKNVDKCISYLKLQWILSFEDIKEISSFYKVDRLIIQNKNMILWRCYNCSSTKLNFQNIFCVVQTSGSTGENKIIRVKNDSIAINASNLRKIFDLKSNDVIFWGTNLTFDPSIIELIVALQSGACLLIVPYKVHINPQALFNSLFTVANVTFLQVVPSVFLRWNEAQIKQILQNSQLRVLAFGGEHFPKRILSYGRKNNLRIFNLYGISEVSCWATIHEISNESQNDDIPIGQTLDETVIELRDRSGIKTNSGKGEIFIGSSSRICYINEESSLDTPAIVFRETGDLAELKDGKMFLVCRKNKIIKRFGHRINLTKIENKIFQETGLENICIWSQENSKLLMFVLMKNFDASLKGRILDKLRIKLINILPDESFPDFIEIIGHFPVTSHGKVNEKALEKLYSISKTTENYEDTFSLLWCKYVGTCTENLAELKHYTFFEMGGNSITAIQLLTELKEISKYEYPDKLVTMIFKDSLDHCVNYLRNTKLLTKISNEKTLQEHVPKRRKTSEGNLEIIWSYDMKACVDSTPLVFEKENTTYIAVGSFSHKFIVFEKDGKIIYETNLPDSVEGTASLSHCKNYLLVGCFNGVMYCMDFLKKKIVWKFVTGSKIKSSACFCKTRSSAIFGSYDKAVYCVLIMEGLELWKTVLDGSISANPVYSESKKNIYTATTKGTCFSLREDNGQINWKKSCSGPIFGTPCLINSDENIVFPAVQGILHCLETRNGQLLWKYHSDGHIFSSLVPHENQIIFGCFDKCVNLLDVSNSKCVLVRRVMVKSEISSTPFVSSVSGSQVVVTACNSGTISVIDFSTFDVLSSIQLPGEVFSSPFVHDNKVFVGCRDNNFYCIQLNK